MRHFFTKYIKSGTERVNPKGTYLFYLLVGLVLAKALYMRLSLPHIAIIDNDISGYLDPALDFLGKKSFDFTPDRGICYPAFVLVNIFFGTSLYPVALCQHLLAILGLVLIALAFVESSGNIIAKCIALLGLMIIGWDNELILLEHTIRPEGLEIFLTGSIFFLLQRLLIHGTNRKTYLALITMLMLMLWVYDKNA